MVSKPKGPRSMCMDNRHTSNIFTLDFSCDNSYIFSGGKGLVVDGRRMAGCGDITGLGNTRQQLVLQYFS